MKLLNTILILIIIIFLINYFSNGQILTTLKRIFNSCQQKVETFTSKQKIEAFTGKQQGCYPSNAMNIPFANQLDFPYINKTNDKQLDEETFNMYEFLNDIVTKNVNIYELSPSYGERTKVSKVIETQITNMLSNMFNCNGYSFNNIKLNQDIYYYENYKGIEFEPFIFTTDIIRNNKTINNVTLLIDCFLRDDNKDKLLTIKNLKLIKRNSPDKIQQVAIQKKLQIANDMNDTFNNISISNDNNDLFIKPPFNVKKQVTFENNETDSLIPSIDEILSI
jgi:hypothetical protein